MVDGWADEYQELGAQPINLSDSVDLYFYQNDHYVWICYTYPSESFGTLDMKIETENLDEPLNLHVSAQVGEWPVNKPELAPKDPLSDRWWNMKGWISNEVWPNGIDRSGEVARPKFKNAPARELQLSKERFGRGKWEISMEIRAIKSSDGFISLQFPENKSAYILNVN